MYVCIKKNPLRMDTYYCRYGVSGEWIIKRPDMEGPALFITESHPGNHVANIGCLPIANACKAGCSPFLLINFHLSLLVSYVFG